MSESLSPPVLPDLAATTLSRSQSIEPVGLGTAASFAAQILLSSLACQVGTGFVGSDSGGEGLKKWVGLERINQVLLAVRKGVSKLDELTDLAGLGGDEQRTFFELLRLFL